VALNIKLTDEEKAWPMNSWEDLGRIMQSILNRELEVSVLPPAGEKKLKINNNPESQLHSIMTTGGNLLDAQVEYFWTIGLRADLRVAFIDLVAIGDSIAAKIGPTEVFRGFVYYNAAQAVVVHNHPSGSLTFSDNDIRVTKNLVRAGWILEKELRDHLIITPDSGLNSLEKESRMQSLFEEAMVEELTARDAAKILALKNEIIKQKEAKIRQAALELLNAHIALERVAEITGLSPAELEQLKNKI
jgi:DNA repair protein RadC